jgi:hypothetical protein
MTHAALPGGWRAITLQDIVRGEEPLERGLHNVGLRGTEKAKAEQDLAEARASYLAGDVTTALAVAASIAEELQTTRQPGRGAAA